MARFSDNVVLITGAGRGIGRAMALRCAQEGAHIVAADIEPMLAESTAAAVGEGVLRFQDMFDITEADWDFILAVNTKGVFFVMQAVAREMVKRHNGKIIKTTSISGQSCPLTGTTLRGLHGDARQ